MNREKLSRVFALGLSGLFICFMFVLLIASILREKTRYSYFENRNLAMPDTFTVEGMLDGSFFASLDDTAKDHSAFRTPFLQLDTYINKDIFRKPLVNDVVISGETLLPWNKYELVDEEKIRSKATDVAERLRRHADIAEGYGGTFYYVAVPCQYVCLEDSYPEYLNNRAEYTAASAQALFGALDRVGVNYIDMNAVYQQMGRPAEYTSQVDNHYEIEGGYITYLTIMDKLQKEKGLAVEILEEGEYVKTQLPNPYLGSRSRKLFGMWDTTEHLSVIYPKEDIPFRRWDGEEPVEASVYALPESEASDVLYGLYMGGDKAQTLIDTDRKELPDVLIYGDSFTNAVEGVLWYSFDTMRSVDFRHYKDMSLDEYITKYQPDVVICVRDYEAMLNTTGNGQ